MRFLRSGHADVDDPHYKGASAFSVLKLLQETNPQFLGRDAKISYVDLLHLNFDDNMMILSFSAEVPQWVYAVLFLVSLGVGIGCSYAGPGGTVLIPAWSILFFTG